MNCNMKLFSCLVLFCLVLNYAQANDVQGCGGYVKSDVEIDFSQVGIRLWVAKIS